MLYIPQGCVWLAFSTAVVEEDGNRKYPQLVHNSDTDIELTGRKAHKCVLVAL